MGREGVAVAKETEMGALRQEPLERLGRTGCNYPQEAEVRRGAAASSLFPEKTRKEADSKAQRLGH